MGYQRAQYRRKSKKKKRKSVKRKRWPGFLRPGHPVYSWFDKD